MKQFIVAMLFVVAAAPSSIRSAAPQADQQQQKKLEAIEPLVRQAIGEKKLPGAVVVVGRGERILYQKAIGNRALVPSGEPMTEDTIFDLASLTKVVATTTSVMILLEEGKIRLSDRVSTFIPGFERYGKADITIRHLMTHMSGLRPDVDLGDAWSGSETAINMAIDEVPTSPPGERFVYSDINYFVLGDIVRRVSGETLDRFAHDRIFAPLGMKDTFFYRDGVQARKPTLYQRVNGALQKVADQAWMNGAYFSGGGGLSSTAEDYFRFALMLASNGELDGARILSRRSVELMTSVFAPDTLPGRNAGEGFGLGVRVVSNPAARNTWLSQGSFGWSGAYNTHFFVDPKEKIVGIFMTQVTLLETRGQLRDDFENAVMQAVVSN